MKIITPRLFTTEAIKLQGVAYYTDCYKFWDLNKCYGAFRGDEYKKLISSFSSNNLFNGRETLAVIDIKEYENSYKSYYASLSPNIRRDIKKSEKYGLYCKEYNFNEFLYDFLDINHSQNRLKGGINPWYLQPLSEYQDSHSGYGHEWEDKQHYSKWYGIFKYLKKYRQGEVETNEKLCAYCKMNVDGEMATVGLVWCHADYLKRGAMVHLMSSVIKNIFCDPNIKYIVYYGMAQPKWKQRMLFVPTRVKAVL